MPNFVRLELAEGAATLILCRAEKANAYHDALLDELARILDRCLENAEVRVLIMAGDGRHFCAGADLETLRARSAQDAVCLQSRAVFDRLARAPLPSVAAVHGAALGGGLELALACDLRIAADDARFGLPETALGYLPAAGGTLRLPRVVGDAKAREMILLGRELSAAEALAAGLVSEVVPRDRLRERAHELARELTRREPLALALAKQALELQHAHDRAALQFEGVAQALLYRRREAVRAAL